MVFVPARRLASTLILLALGAAACTGGSASPRPDRSLILPSPEAANATQAPLLPTGRFELPEFDREKLERLLRDLRGTPVVLNLWASWCGPCREEAPHLRDAALEFGDRVQFLGVDVKDDLTQARVFIRDSGWPYPSVFDPYEEIKISLGFYGLPVTLFFDRRGERISFTQAGNRVDAWSGPITRDALFDLVKRLAAS
jgi:cytochrome c biogenesis protein CcmG, thiol:disulfide interchange protein DsbE